MHVLALQLALAAGGGMAEDDLVAGLEVGWRLIRSGHYFTPNKTGTVEREQLLVLHLHIWDPLLLCLHWIKSCWQKRAEVVMET